MLRTCDGEVRGHQVDGLGEVLPRTGDALDVGLPAELSFRADLARDARDFRRERRELRDHRVHGLRGAEELALERTAVELDGHRPREVALRDRADDARDLVGRLHEVGDEVVHRLGHHRPLPAGGRDLRALIELAFLADDGGDALDLRRGALVELEDVVQRVGDLPLHADELHRHAHGEVALLHRCERAQQQPLEILRPQLGGLLDANGRHKTGSPSVGTAVFDCAESVCRLPREAGMQVKGHAVEGGRGGRLRSAGVSPAERGGVLAADLARDGAPRTAHAQPARTPAVRWPLIPYSRTQTLYR